MPGHRMLAVERPRRTERLLLLLVLALAPAAALAQVQEPALVRLRDAVGDTIDAAERDSLGLFPNTAGFQHAVILAIPGPEFFAEVTLAAGYTPRQVFLRIMPTELERIRFLIDNREYAEQQRSDSSAARVLASFWHSIEKQPLRSISGEPAVVQEVRRAPPAAMALGEHPSEPATGVVRLHDAVGDTIDAAERDSFRLFPNTAGFRQAVILAPPGQGFFAEVTLTAGDTVKSVFFRILAGQMQKVRFLINNRQSMSEQLKSDSSAALALAAFWQEIESQPLRNVTGEPADVQNISPGPSEEKPASNPADVATISPAPTEAATAGVTQSQPVSEENRYNYVLHGVTLGSCVGGCIGSWAGIEQVGYNYGECLSGPVYAVNHPVFWTAACGVTALGSTAGYMIGDKLDRQPVSPLPQPKESKNWRTGCAVGAAIPGLLLGTAFFTLVGGSHYGKTEIFRDLENDPSGLTVVPTALTGLCIAVELATIGYRIGRSIDRRNAKKAAAKQRALGR